jgi:PAS domain S-box-containing protein
MGNIASWNAGAERFKGYTASEITGRHFSLFYTEKDIARGVPVTALETSKRTGKFEAKGWRVRRDGMGPCHIDPIRSPSGILLGFAKLTRDLTERRQAQQHLEEAREALFQLQKKEAIGQLTGGIARDFNNLLMAVLGSLEIVQGRIGDAPRIAPRIANAMQAAVSTGTP